MGNTAFCLPNRQQPVVGPEQNIQEPLLNISEEPPQTSIRTPKKIPTFPKGLEQTPMDSNKEIYKYYCPLCMCYFPEILELSCCRNYICAKCAYLWLEEKGISTSSTDDGIVFDKTINSTCPVCNSNFFSIRKVTMSAPIRNYSNTPSVNKKTKLEYNGGSLQIGETFDDLEHKMLSFDVDAIPATIPECSHENTPENIIINKKTKSSCDSPLKSIYPSGNVIIKSNSSIHSNNNNNKEEEKENDENDGTMIRGEDISMSNTQLPEEDNNNTNINNINNNNNIEEEQQNENNNDTNTNSTTFVESIQSNQQHQQNNNNNLITPRNNNNNDNNIYTSTPNGLTQRFQQQNGIILSSDAIIDDILTSDDEEGGNGSNKPTPMKRLGESYQVSHYQLSDTVNLSMANTQ